MDGRTTGGDPSARSMEAAGAFALGEAVAEALAAGRVARALGGLTEA